MNTLKQTKAVLVLFLSLFVNQNIFAAETVDIKYTSYRPTLREFISGDFKKQPATLTGKLTLPSGAGPFPVLVWVHGMGGQSIYEDNGWMTRLKKISLERGVAVYVVDSYTERRISNEDAMSGKVILNMAARLTDTFAASNALAKDSRIDHNKMFVIGHSFGGLVSIASASTTVIKAVKELGVTFAGHIPLSPECLTRPQDMDYDGKPMLIIVGENDELTPANHCMKLIEEMKPNSNVNIKIIKGGTHDLMSSGRAPFETKMFGYDGCGRWVFDKNGAYTLPDMGGVNNGAGENYSRDVVNEFNKVVSSCAKLSSTHEVPSDKVRGEVESLLGEYLDKYVVVR